ncbi:MAG: hypothetical protein ACI379_05150 [Nocardioides sp.]|uniref:hypothetical protein n=1 Tax=Nocardioides sp. TaxID=35761 RepID=UPI003F04B222
MLKVLLVIVVVTVTVYLLLRLLERGGVSRATKQNPRTIAPDDDVDFLRDIDRKRPHPHDDSEG